MKSFRINGIGCSLMDFLYSGIDFDSETFKKYQSKLEGDGGLSPGRLVFAHEFEKFSGKAIEEVLKELTGDRTPDSLNVGGPCIVALIHAAQMLWSKEVLVSYYGFAGQDSISDQLFSFLSSTPLNIGHYRRTMGVTPYTLVLSDPGYHDGKGERAFINHLGAAWNYSPELIDPTFFEAGITVFGGTALVPNIHDKLHDLLLAAKKNGAITLVNTVYDFRNEKEKPGKPWPLGQSEKSFPLIDLLIADHVEALKITGERSIDTAAAKLIKYGAGTFVITDGANPVTLYSDGRLFKALPATKLAASEAVIKDTYAKKDGDTTGCGDNFVGGVIASLAEQLIRNEKNPDLMEAASWGIVSGGFACFYLGGTYFEKEKGEKLTLIQNLYDQYQDQIR